MRGQHIDPPLNGSAERIHRLKAGCARFLTLTQRSAPTPIQTLPMFRDQTFQAHQAWRDGFAAGAAGFALNMLIEMPRPLFGAKSGLPSEPTTA